MTPAGASTFATENYDAFMDCPIEISDFSEKTFTLAGTTYHVIVHDIIGKRDFSRFAEDLKKAVEIEVDLLAPVAGDTASGRKAPFTDYWFLFNNWPGAGGGLEHLNSTQIFLRSDWATLLPDGSMSDQHIGQLSVSAHEFFHAWNVKRLRPRPLGPFDYSREVHTPSLWISEGLTNYFSSMALLRAGLTKPERHLERLGAIITNIENTPARNERSLEDTSFDTWFWYVGEGRMPTNRAAVDFDYYTGGELMGHLLDFSMRQATGNQKSLDDWLRLMYSRYALPKPGFEPEDAVRAASEVAGKDMGDFFRRYISGKETPPYAEMLGWAGIEVKTERDSAHGWFGMEVRDDAGTARVSFVYPASPAENSGLDRNDRIVAADNRAVTTDELTRALEAARPGGTLRLTVNHLGTLKELTLTAGTNPRVNYRLRRMESLSDSQRRMFEGWSRQP
jgi:predicted metalloprotease with PDZ domain